MAPDMTPAQVKLLWGSLPREWELYKMFIPCLDGMDLLFCMPQSHSDWTLSAYMPAPLHKMEMERDKGRHVYSVQSQVMICLVRQDMWNWNITRYEATGQACLGIISNLCGVLVDVNTSSGSSIFAGMCPFFVGLYITLTVPSFYRWITGDLKSLFPPWGMPVM